MVTPELRDRFHEWADEALGGPVPEGIAAFSFNLYETTVGAELELVGCDAYSEDDLAWAQSEVFTARDPAFEISVSRAGTHWQVSLDLALELVMGYLEREERGSRILRGAAAVVVGFVDGDLQRVWPPVA